MTSPAWFSNYREYRTKHGPLDIIVFKPKNTEKTYYVSCPQLGISQASLETNDGTEAKIQGYKVIMSYVYVLGSQLERNYEEMRRSVK